MKASIFALTGFILSLSSLNGANQERVQPSDLTGDLFRYNGMIIRPDGARGSGIVVRHPQVVLTSAHLVHGQNTWLEGDFKWYWRYEGTNPETELSSGREPQTLRYYTRWTSYQSALSSGGHAFNEDLAVFYSYRTTADGSCAPWARSGPEAMKSTRAKAITGYPATLLDWEPADPRANWNLIFTGPTNSPYTGYDRFMVNPDLKSRPGNSGGPVWVNDGAEWLVAGIYVSGGSSGGGAVSLDEAAWDLVDQAIQSTLDDHGNDNVSATRLTPNDSMIGAIENAGDRDRFSVEIMESGLLTIETYGSTDTRGSLWTEKGELIGHNDDWAEGNFLIHQRVDPGKHFIEVTAFEDEQGPYTIATTFQPHGPDDHSNTPETPTTILHSEPASGFISFEGDKDFFLYESPGNEMVSIGTSGLTDTKGSLFNEAGDLLLSNDDGESINFSFNAFLSPGRYLIKVEGFDTGTRGAYDLSVSAVPGDGISYHEWSRAHEFEATSEHLDPDRDGLHNLAEFALGTNPRIPDLSDPVQLITSPNGIHRIEFRRNTWAKGVVTTVQVSSDLQNWQSIASHPVSGATNEEVWGTEINHPGVKRLFVRLHFSPSESP
ncbi:MAG: hypothetical protein AAF514_12165 [Verrucomicrobiota bacterium]